MTVKPSKESSCEKIHLTINKNKMVKTLIRDRKPSAQQQPAAPTTRQASRRPPGMRTSAVRSLFGHSLTSANTLLSPVSSCINNNMAQSANLWNWRKAVKLHVLKVNSGANTIMIRVLLSRVPHVCPKQRGWRHSLTRETEAESGVTGERQYNCLLVF